MLALYQEILEDAGTLTQVYVRAYLQHGRSLDLLAEQVQPELIFGMITTLRECMSGLFRTNIIVGARMLPEARTQPVSRKAILRVMGFASAPGILRVLGFIPGFEIRWLLQVDGRGCNCWRQASAEL